MMGLLGWVPYLIEKAPHHLINFCDPYSMGALNKGLKLLKMFTKAVDLLPVKDKGNFDLSW